MLGKTPLFAAIAAFLAIGVPCAVHAQETPAPDASYVYYVGVKGLSAPPPACVAGVVQETQTASCPAGQTVDGTADGATVFTQSFDVTTACPSGEYGEPVVTQGVATPTAEDACDPVVAEWVAFFADLGVTAPSPWSAGFKLGAKGVSSLPGTPYPAATVDGDIDLYSNAITNVNGLSSLQSIAGRLNLNGNTQLNDISGLASLRSVGGALFLSNNIPVADVNALASLQSVGGVLDLSQNPNLANVDGLSGLQSVGGHLSIFSESSLTNINGLSSLQTVGGSLNMPDNVNLANVSGLSSLQAVGGELNLRNNPKLTNVGGLSSLRSVGSNLYLYQNPGLTDLSGLSGLQTVGGEAYFDNGIQLRAGFVPIQGGALCASSYAAKFPGVGYATQAQVCASVH